MSNQSITVEPSAALARLIEEYHVEASMGTRLSSTFLPYFEQAKALLDQAAEVNITDPTQVTEIKQSGEIRRALKKLRCDAEAKRKEFKAPFWNAIQAIDFAPKLLASQTEPVEKRLLDGERIAERMEQERKAKVTAARYEAIRPFLNPADPFDMSGLENMTPAAFQAFKIGLAVEHERRESERRKAAAAARIAEAARRAEQAKLAEEAAKQRAENERLRKEQAEQEAAYLAQLDAERKAAQEKLAAERAAAAAVARKDREARDKMEQELMRKRLEEDAAKMKLQQEAAKKAAEEARVAAAPDIEKVKIYVAALLAVPRPGVTNAGCVEFMANLVSDLEYYESNAEIKP